MTKERTFSIAMEAGDDVDDVLMQTMMRALRWHRLSRRRKEFKYGNDYWERPVRYLTCKVKESK